MRTISLNAFLFLTAWLAAAPAALGQKSTVYGVIEALDREVGTVTVLLPPRHEAKQYSLSRPDLPVTNALGQLVKLADLAKLDRVQLQLNDIEDVAAIRVDEDCEWATISKVGPDEGKLTIKVKSLERTLPIRSGAAVLVDGKKAQLADLKSGQGVKAVLSPDHQTILQLEAGKGISASSPYHRLKHQSGILLKVDHEKKTFQVLASRARPRVEEFEFQPWAGLRLTHSSYLLRTTNISQLHSYCKVSFYFESDSRKVAQVSAEAPTYVRERVASVNHAARQLTITEEEGPVKLTVAREAMIRTPRGLGRWEDVAEGKVVTCSMSLDGQEVLYVYIWDK